MCKRVARALAVLMLAAGTSGCAALLVGAGLAGGYAISKDSVRNQFDLSKETVYQQSVAIAKDMGFVSLEDPQRGEIHLKIGDANVTITVRPLTRRSTELKVRARNAFMMPEIEVAQQVYNKIVEKL